MSTPSIVCVSILSPDDSLFYIKKYKTSKSENDIELDSLVFLSLDYFGQGKGFKAENKVSFILSKDSYSTFGSKTFLGYKIIVIISGLVNPSQINPVILSLSEKIKNELYSSFFDPFYVPFAPTTSPIFKKRVDEFVENTFID